MNANAQEHTSHFGYRFIDHPSDIGMEVQGTTLEELFVNAALGMLSIIAKPKRRTNLITKNLNMEEDSKEELLHTFLSEILWLVTTENLFPVTINFENIDEHSFLAHIKCMKLQKNQMECEVKAVTYHKLNITRKNTNYFTTLIFDV